MIQILLKKAGGYFRRDFAPDLQAGFITAIVALPLAIAFAIASGLDPIMGLHTAIVAGILAALFAGSPFSITGPTGAMAIIILSTYHQFGLSGLLLAGFFAGVMQVLMGVLRIGRLIKFMPFPIISGFTGGIGLLILLGQIPNALGLSLPSQEHIWQTLGLALQSIGQTQLPAVLIAVGTIAMLAYLPRLFMKVKVLKAVPPSMVALLLTTTAAYALSLVIPTVGAIPNELPRFQGLSLSWGLLHDVLPAAFTIAMLGAIESLLCAVVADGMTNTKHRSDQELVAQGVTNMALPFFGGMAATAAIARTAVNIREGAKTRMASVYHAAFLALIVIFLGPLASHIPKAFLAGVLIFVAARMISLKEFHTIWKTGYQEGTVLVVTLALTVLTDLVFAVQVGLMFAVGLIFLRFSKLFDITEMSEYDLKNEIPQLLAADPKLKDKVSVYTVNGPFFFGAMSVFDRKLQEHMNATKPYLLLRMKYVPFIDATATERLKQFIRDRNKAGGKVFLVTIQPRVREAIFTDEEFREIIVDNNLFESTEEAVHYIRRKYIRSIYDRSPES
jgi:SulP family sulfate permease